ncbi:M3 family oligoendopeptidase [Peribacillus psychrosaccharolyticus]|uniref:M3 family oligoendopeptidase n=1 Tax=Peribacillus psychrosaccharolyticus TaxID=1407 RepID=UPI003D2E7781
MEQIMNQNWDLASLYPDETMSNKLLELSAELDMTIETLSENLKQLNRSSGIINLSKLVKFIQRTQYVQNGSEEFDDLLICIYAQNTNNTEVIGLLDHSAVIKSKLQSIQLELNLTLANLSEDLWAELLRLSEVDPIAFYLLECRQKGKEQLPLEMERLISSLSINGIKGLEQHYEQMLTKIRIPLKMDGEIKEVSIGQALNEAIYAKNRLVRQDAALAIKHICEKNADLFASVLNRIAGFRLTIYEQRGWDNLLKELCLQNRIMDETLQTMLTSINQHKELIKSYIQRKIELGQIKNPSWFDLESPHFTVAVKVPYQDAVTLIIEQFETFSDSLGKFAEEAFEADWIETENRPSKAEGGFCASFPLSKQSRIFLTYRENYQDVITIAHELGHAYHNYILHKEPAFAQQKGTSLAETASTFMENLVVDAVIKQTTSKEEKLALLEMKISNGLKYVGTIPNMFKFEQEFYEKRKANVVTAEEINTLISKAENELYDGLIEDLAVHKWMYISHFYNAEKAFYNIPYTIGYLFSNGIYERLKNSENGVEQLNELLRSSGRMTVEQLAERYLGVDATKTTFWDRSLQPLREAIEEYLYLTEDI